MHPVIDWSVAIGSVLLLAGLVQQARRVHGGRRPASRQPRNGQRRTASGGAQRRSPAGQSSGGGWLAHRRRLRELREKARLERIRDQARHGHRLEQEKARAEHERERDREWAERGDGAPPRRGVPRVIKLKPEGSGGKDGAPQSGTAPSPGSAASPPAPDAPGKPASPEPAPEPKPARAPAPAPVSADAPPNRKDTPVTSPAIRTGTEDLITAIDRIRAGAQAGNIHAKRAALSAASEAASRFAAMAQSLSRAMAEMGHYGTEITEPASTAGIHLTAAASAFAEAESALKALLDMQVGELATSGRQAPHHHELSETGAR